jgi:septal ring factor EnvC (AmiA/AmiB activator)
MPSLQTATDDLNRAAQDLAKQHAKYREAQDEYDAAVKKSNKEHDYWFKNPSERNVHDLQEAYAAQREAEQELNEEKRKFGEKLRAFLIAQQAYFLALQAFLIAHL